MDLMFYIKNDNHRLINKYLNKLKNTESKNIIKILDYAIKLKKYKTIRLILLYNNVINNDDILDILINYEDDTLIYLYQNELNIEWDIIINKYKKINKYNKIIRIIINKKLIINITSMDNEFFKKILIEENKIDMNLLDILITNKLEDKIIVYCNYGIITESLIEILLEQYNNYDLTKFLINFKNITNKMIEIIIKNNKENYLNIIKNNLSHEKINSVLEYSLKYNYQYGIDISICYNANYLLVLDKFMKK